jgi:hypothetical protein
MSFPPSRGITAARVLQFCVSNDFFHHLPVDLTPLASVAERQRIEAKIVDPAWDASAAFCQHRLRLGTEKLPAAVTRDAQAVRDILRYLRSFKRREPAETRDALTQLF